MRKGMKLSIIVLMVVFTMLFAAAFSVSAKDYVLYLGSTPVTSDNAADILGDGTASYDEATATLTLNGAEVADSYSFSDGKSTSRAVVYSEQDLNIAVSGDSTLTSASAVDAQTSYGIYVQGDLSFLSDNSDEITLNVHSGNAPVTYGIFVSGSVNMLSDNTAVKAYAGNADSLSYGVYCGTGLLSEFGYLYAYSGDVSSVTSADSIGLYAPGINVIKQGKLLAFAGTAAGKAITRSIGIMFEASLAFEHLGGVNAVAGDAASSDAAAYSLGIYAEEGKISSTIGRGTLNGTARNAEGGEARSIGVYLPDGSMELLENPNSVFDTSSSFSSSDYQEIITVMAIGDDATTESIGLCVSSVTSTGGRIDAYTNCNNGNASALSVYTGAEFGKVVRDAYTGEVLSFDSEKGTYVDSDGNTLKNIRSVSFSEKEADDVLYVAGNLVTEDNASDVLGDNTVRYDFETRTLYLTNATIKGTHIYRTQVVAGGEINKFSAAIYAEQNLNICVSGTNTVIDTSEGSYETAGMCFSGNTLGTEINVIVYGDGSEAVLNVHGAASSGESNAIDLVSADIYFVDITANLYGGDSKVSCGITCSGLSSGQWIEWGSSSDERAYGVTNKFGGNLTVNNCTLNAFGCDINTKDPSSSGITARRIVVVGSSEVNAYGGDVVGISSAASAGIGVVAELFVSDLSVVNAYGGTSEITDETDITTVTASSLGVATLLGTVSVDNGAVVNGVSDDVTVADSADNAYSIGVVSIGGIIVDGEDSAISGKANAAEDISAGVYASQAFVYDGRVVGAAQSKDGAPAVGVMVVTEMEHAVVSDDKGQIYSFSEQVGYINSDGGYAPNMTIVPGDAILYNIWVGGVKVTNFNMNDVLGDGGSVKYDTETNTLFLNNANITGAYELQEGMTAGIYTEIPLNIVVSGTNTITTGTTGSNSEAGIAYYGPEITDGTAITITGKSTEDVLNVNTSDSLSLNALIVSTTGGVEFNNLTVNAIGGDSGEATYGVVGGINGLGDVVVDGAIVNVTLGDVVTTEGISGTSTGVISQDLDIINNGELNIIVGDVTSDVSGTCVGTQTIGNLTVAGGSSLNTVAGDVTGTGDTSAVGSSSIGSMVVGSAVIDGSSSVIATGGNLSIEADNTDDFSAGFAVNSTITVAGNSTVNGTGGVADNTSYGVFGSTIVITDGMVEGTSSSEAKTVSAGIASNNEIAETTIYDNKTGEELTFDSSIQPVGYVNSEGNFSTSMTAVSDGAFDIWVGGVQVTTKNMYDVLGDGTVSYDSVTDTLTLNNANIKAFGNKYASNCSIYSGNSLNIVLVGENHLEVLPDETKADEFAIGIRAYGDVTVSSVEQATLDIDVGVAQRENFGFYIVDGGITVNGKVALDITLDDFVITSSDSDFGNSIGIHCEDSAYFYDEVSIRCETGNIFMSEDGGFVGDPGSINSGGASVGVAVYGNLVFDTSGELYFYIKDSDGKRAGIACFGELELKQGSVVVEMSESKGAYLVAGAVVYLSLDDNCPCIPLCGTSENDLSTGSIGDISLDGFALKYTAAANGSLARYTKLVTSVVGLPKVETDDTGEQIVYVKIEDEEKAANALVVFAAYNENGKMTDVKFSDGSAAKDGKISAKLNISDAVKVTVFVFENDNSFRPLSPELTTTVLSQAE